MNRPTDNELGLWLDEKTHTYYRRDAEGDVAAVRASVTGVLRSTVIRDAYYRADPAVRDAKAVVGTRVHKDARLVSAGLWDPLVTLEACPRALPYVDAWAGCIAREGLRKLEHDIAVFHEWHNYAGEIDVFAWDRYGPVVVDLKIGEPYGVAWQTVAYVDALWADRHRHAWLLAGAGILTAAEIQRWCVQLKPNGKYAITRFANYYDDILIWDACLTVYNQQQAIGA